MSDDAVLAAPTSLRYEGPARPPDGEPQEIAPGLLGVRLALPFALDHVHVWLLAGRDGWTLIDTGVADDRTRECWDALLRSFLRGRPVTRILATHFHPDHMGLAGWLVERTGAAFMTTRTEWLLGRLLAQDTSAAFVAAGREFDRHAGLPEDQIETRAARGNLYRTRALPPPAAFVRIRAGDRLRMGEGEWRVLIGRGHAPEMACLFNAERNLLIAADQILPRISPNVSVWPSEPEADPLAEFRASLEPLRALPEDCLVLPSHGRPFRGLHARMDQLIAHHDERLAKALEICARPMTAAEIMPALFERQLDQHQLGFALGETLAHLNHLVARGDLVHSPDVAGRLRYARR